MSTEKSTNVNSLCAKIIARLKLGDDGKVMNFLNRVIKADTRAVENLQRNLESMKLKHSQEVEDLESKIQDATAALEEVYESIDVERIKTNADCDSYMSVYCTNIANAEAAVKTLQDSQQSMQDSFEKATNEAVAKIKSLKARIKKLS